MSLPTCYILCMYVCMLGLRQGGGTRKQAEREIGGRERERVRLRGDGGEDGEG